MPKEAVHLSLAGVVIFCRATRNWLNMVVVECLHKARNYWGELIGMVLSLIILQLQAATTTLVAPFFLSTLFCDNCGVISHSNSPQVALSEKQKHSNLIWLVKHLLATNKKYIHNVGLGGGTCSQAEGLGQLHIAGMPEPYGKQAGKRCAFIGYFWWINHGGQFFFQSSTLWLSGERVCGSPCQALEWDWGCRTAWMLYADKGIIQGGDFHLIWWDGLRVAMAHYPKMYKVWLTKHVLACGGTNVQLSYRKRGEQTPKWEFCGTADEFSSHIRYRQDPV
jgi:hypothetical protein